MENVVSGEFAPPQNHPNSPPDPDPAQKRLWEALGQPLEGLEEVWEGDFDEKNAILMKKT